jgi:hypothetical protein
MYARDPRAPVAASTFFRDAAKSETTASLMLLSGSPAVKLYRELHEFERSNSQRPALEGGSVFVLEHLRRICEHYQQLCEDDSPGLVTRAQLQAIVRGAISAPEEKNTSRLFKLRDLRGAGRIDFPKFMIEFMMPVTAHPGHPISAVDKLGCALATLSIDMRPEGAKLPVLEKSEVTKLLGWALKVTSYYLQWANDVFTSLDSYPIPGAAARHRLMLLRESEALPAHPMRRGHAPCQAMGHFVTTPRFRVALWLTLLAHACGLRRRGGMLGRWAAAAGQGLHGEVPAARGGHGARARGRAGHDERAATPGQRRGGQHDDGHGGADDGRDAGVQRRGAAQTMGTLSVGAGVAWRGAWHLRPSADAVAEAGALFRHLSDSRISAAAARLTPPSAMPLSLSRLPSSFSARRIHPPPPPPPRCRPGPR